jgi:hypothetical protein
MDRPSLASRSVIEDLFTEHLDQDALERVRRLSLDVQLEWERSSPIFSAGLARTQFWELEFARQCPVTSERLQTSVERRAHAEELMKRVRIRPAVNQNIWRSLLSLLDVSNQRDQAVSKVDDGAETAVQLADEFGVDHVHFISCGVDFVRTIQFERDSVSGYATRLDTTALEGVMDPVKAWSVPFQDACVVLYQNRNTGATELVCILTPAIQRSGDKVELSMFALNRNAFAEDPSTFRAPPFLTGDATLRGRQPLMASTENGVTAIVIRQRDVLLFDKRKEGQSEEVRHWRMLVTAELWEPRRIPVVAVCYVLDSLLLYASADGVLRAHPRRNPQSTYHVEELDSLVTHMVGMYNVVVIVHSYNVLEIRSVAQKAEDPYVEFPSILHCVQGVDADHAPLLYGPYCIYKSLNGSWYRVRYEGTNEPQRELIKVPYKAGWEILSIKSANWRYWILVLRNPQTQNVEEYFLFAGGGTNGETPRPFLVAREI